jgi:hypothetical protein
VDEEQALGRLAAILAQPQFQLGAGSGAWDRWLQSTIASIQAQIVSFLVDLLGVATGRVGWVGPVVLAVSLGIVVAALVFLGRAIGQAIGHDDRLRETSAAERRARSDALWREAQALAAAGRWPEAARVAYLSAMYALDERAVLRLQGGLTNHEHALSLARAHPDRAGAFADLVDHYDRLRYGGYPITAGVFDDLSARVARARAEATA